jgi:hypothetical protein
MEFRLVFGNEEETIGDFKPSDVEPLVSVLKKSEIIDFEGRVWHVSDNTELYFSSFPPYFYLALESIENQE